MKIKIDPEFQKLIPPLSAEELAQLEANIVADGCREPLTVWQETGILLDGHNRYAICQKHGLDYDTWPLTLPGRSEAMEWIIRNQFGRRNLPTVIHLELSIKLKEVIAERAKENLRTAEPGVRGGSPLFKCTKAILDESPDAPAPTIRASVAPKEEPATTPINTRKEIAEMAGVSEATVHRYEKIAASPTYDAARARILAGETSINKEYADVRREEKKQETIRRISEVKKNPIPVYDVLPELVLADPPWRYEHVETNSRAIENQYPTATLQDIFEHSPKTADDCVLLLWATAPKLEEAMQVLDAWGFNYRSCAVWDKKKIGMGYWFRGQHELLLVGVKGKASPPAELHRVSSIFAEARTAHSKKPECVYSWVEDAFFDRPKLEMYCRATRPGWMVWGNEV